MVQHFTGLIVGLRTKQTLTSTTTTPGLIGRVQEADEMLLLAITIGFCSKRYRGKQSFLRNVARPKASTSSGGLVGNASGVMPITDVTLEALVDWGVVRPLSVTSQPLDCFVGSLFR